MKKIIFLLLIAHLTFNIENCLCQWVWQNPLPQGNWLYGVDIINQNTVVATGDGAVFMKSTNAGNNWTVNHFFSGFNHRSFYNIKFTSENTGWICGDSGSILKTTNGGMNWNYLNTGTQTQINKLYFFNEQIGFACGNSGLILKTTNSGQNWISGNLKSLTSNSLMDIYFVNSSTGFVCGTVYTSPNTTPTLQKTTNGGVNWFTSIPLTVSVSSLRCIYFVNEQTGFAGGNYQGTGSKLIKTTNGGANWQEITVPSGGEIISVNFANENTGWINATTKFCKTTDGGANWIVQYSQDGSTCNWGFSSFSVFNQNLILAVECGKILRSTNGGTNFTEPGRSNRDWHYKIFFNDEFTGWTDRYGGISKTTDGGNNWFNINLHINSDPEFYFKDANTGWYIGTDSLGYIFHKSTNGGINWTGYNYPRRVYEIIFANQNTGYLRGDSVINGVNYGALYKTTNAGSNWSLVYLSTECILNRVSLVNATTGFSIALFNQADCLFKTTNAGSNWTTINSMPSGFTVNEGLNFVNENTGYVVCRNATGVPRNIFKTTNGGLNWTDLGLTYLNLSHISKIHFFNASTGYLFAVKGAANSETYYLTTTNGGLNWTVSMPGVANGINDAYFINNNTGWACGGEGTILKTTNGGSVFAKNISKEIPNSFSLYQNYPNPFNPATTIRFETPLNPTFGKGGTGGLVTLKVYNLLGKEMATLVNEKLSAGTYEVNWDASAYPSGVYFYKLSSGDYTETKKMLMIK
jgi:photosystem II stability/assembly factor-like uncharacterized protein